MIYQNYLDNGFIFAGFIVKNESIKKKHKTNNEKIAKSRKKVKLFFFFVYFTI